MGNILLDPRSPECDVYGLALDLTRAKYK